MTQNMISLKHSSKATYFNRFNLNSSYSRPFIHDCCQFCDPTEPVQKPNRPKPPFRHGPFSKPFRESHLSSCMVNETDRPLQPHPVLAHISCTRQSSWSWKLLLPIQKDESIVLCTKASLARWLTNAVPVRRRRRSPPKDRKSSNETAKKTQANSETMKR